MIRPALTALLLLLAPGCDLVLSLEGATPDAPPPDGPPADAPIDAPPAVTVPFSAPALMGEFSSVFEENAPSLTNDLLEIYVQSGGDIWYATRDSSEVRWRNPAKVEALSTNAHEQRPRIAADGLSMYFTRSTPSVGDDIFFTTRPDRTSQSWTTPVAVQGDINTAANEIAGWAAPDGLTLYFDRNTGDSATADLYVATRASTQDPFLSTRLDGLSSPQLDTALWSSADGSTLLFASRRAGGNVGIWEAQRDGSGWLVEPRAELNSDGDNTNPWISADGKTVIFASNRSIGPFRADANLFMATR